MPREARGQGLTWSLPALYVLSGAAALILEVTWSRLLTLQLGHTTGATSTVLAAFMGGLALGAALGGRVAERVDRKRALRVYAALEVIVAVSALILPFVLNAFDPLLAWAYADGEGGWRFGVVRVIASLAALMVPTMAMGGTYPLAMRALVVDPMQAGRAAGYLYAANTFGAAVGALAAGFVLLPAVGIRMTTLVAVSLNVAAAGIAWWWLAARLPGPVVGPDGKVRVTVKSSLHRMPPIARYPWVGVVAAAAFGLVALANQVVWTRVIALIVGPTTYAFSAMVGVFIAGLAVGAVIGTRLARGARAALWLAVMAMGAGVAIALSMHFTGELLLWNALAAASDGVSAAASAAGAAGAAGTAGESGVEVFGAIVWRQIAVAAALIGPLSIASGAAFPLTLAVASNGGLLLTPLRLSSVYAANTAGAIAGALLAGFVFVPAFGLQMTLRITALAIVAIGALVLFFSKQRFAALAAGVVVAAGVFAMASWEPALLSSGAYRFAPAIAGQAGGAAGVAGVPGAANVDADELEALLTAGDLLFYDEGESGTVAVRRLGGTTSLVIDGKPDASNDADMLTQKLLAHLPLLHHEAPRRALVLGLGSGVTAGAALTHRLTNLDVVEISPGVVSASNYFRSENRSALADPRTRLLVADGRSHLRLASSSYDVVISEPSNPWMAGVASLFTREFMTSVRERLAPGGVFCQWTHTYDMSRDDLRSIVATFTSVFPHASLWLVGESDVLLIGSASPLKADAEAMWRRYIVPDVRDDLRTVAVSGVRDLLGLRVADAAALRRYTMDAAVQTDDRMALEFSAPRSLVDRAGARNAAELLGLAAAPPVAATTNAGNEWASRGRMMLRAEAFDLAYEALAKAIELAVGDEETLAAFARAAAGAGKLQPAITRAIAWRAPPVAKQILVSRLYVATGDAAKAIAAIDFASMDLATDGIHAGDPRILREQASIYADVGDADRLAPIVARLRELEPASRDTQYFSAALAFMQGDLASALTQAQALVTAHPNEARAHNLIGAALATRAQGDDAAGARAAFARAIAADPRDAAAYVNAGSLDLTQDRPADARRHFAIALTLDPSNESARQGLATARGRSTQP